MIRLFSILSGTKRQKTWRWKREEWMRNFHVARVKEIRDWNLWIRMERKGAYSHNMSTNVKKMGNADVRITWLFWSRFCFWLLDAGFWWVGQRCTCECDFEKEYIYVYQRCDDLFSQLYSISLCDTVHNDNKYNSIFVRWRIKIRWEWVSISFGWFRFSRSFFLSFFSVNFSHARSFNRYVRAHTLKWANSNLVLPQTQSLSF